MTSEIAKTYEPPASQDRVLQQPFVHPVVMVGKRSVDVVGAGSLLIAALPLFPLIALAIRMESPGPVLFQQLRVGRTTDSFSELFQMNKFRSMRSDAESRSGAVWATKNDNRITRVGKFLRKTRLDELPQLINVLRGEMSLVGPWPERPSFCRKLEQEIPFYIERTWGLRPGITGWAQVNQGYDETLDDVRSKILYDFSYAMAMRSPFSWLVMEAKVVCRTVMVMAFGRGQ